ncbi:flagellin N-terminal helical domain-containing protein [Thermodesulfobacterium commune]|uniref:Flagellin n=2 Tax=Thermodesulfobacterium commune TaxID=1741 RepID=A0A075WRN1_9BACT|nr:flagellin [Thermodesulfobacterium commune]AIH03645.1 flagellin [Thermodesulfobacterium commune DSM 2178]
MAVKINFNEAAAQTHTALLRNERAMNKSLLRLSTGVRILNASDDSAGLFIADMLGTVAKGYDQGNRNIQTGISALQIAEASAGQIFDKLQEIYVRAQNAANDINDPIARAALQQEIRNFVDAIQKIGADTEYNGIKLLDGTFKDKYIHYGARLEQTVYLSIDDVRAQSLGAHMIKTSGNKVAASDVLTSLTDVVFGTNQTITVGGRVIDATIQNVNGSTTNYILDAGYMAEQINSNLSDIGFKAKAINVSIGEKYTAIADVSDTATLTFYVGDKSFSFTAETTISLDELVEKINREAATAGADLTASTDAGRLVLTSSKGYTIGVEISLASATGTININQIVNDLENASAGTIQSQTSATTASAVKVGDLYIANDKNFTLDLGSVTNTALGNFEIGSTTGSQFKNLYSINVTSNEGAEASMLIAEVALRKVDTIRAQIGATMNNLQSIFDSQKVAYDNTKEAESVIRNTDYAKEMAEFTTYQIRMQATVAMLAQANTQPQLVLQLLR